MSLNRYEQAVFEYWERAPDERRHWQTKVVELTRGGANVMLARGLERELWGYLQERSENVPALRNLGGSGRVVEVAKQIWKDHESDLRAADDLFYTWQYDMRWAAQELQQEGKLSKGGKDRTWFVT